MSDRKLSFMPLIWALIPLAAVCYAVAITP